MVPGKWAGSEVRVSGRGNLLAGVSVSAWLPTPPLCLGKSRKCALPNNFLSLQYQVSNIHNVICGFFSHLQCTQFLLTLHVSL